MPRLVSPCVLILVASVLGSAFAQPPRERRGPRPGRTVVRVGSSAQARLELFRLPQVREELAVTSEQREKVDAVMRELQEAMRDIFDRGRNPELSREERRQQFEDGQQKIREKTAAAESRLTEILDEKQLGRLKQLHLQRSGVDAFVGPEVAEQLELTDEQREQIQSIRTKNRPRRGFSSDFIRMELQRKQALTAALAVLNDDQRGRWKELIGTPFKFPARFGSPFMNRPPRELVAQFDTDNNGWLNQVERKAARDHLHSERSARSGRRRRRSRREPAETGPQVARADVESHPDRPLYDPSIVRTFFFEFENDDWELELQDFHGSDVEVPAVLTVDGKRYTDVGVRFRGMSSYGMVSPTYKRSLNVSLDFANKDQRLYGYKTLNLLNSAGDASFMSTVLYSRIASDYVPVPKANHVRVVVNGESWGVYVNVQQFDKVFLDEHFASSKGTRWKVRGNPQADGGLRYLGDDLEEYKRRFQMKSNDGKKAWRALVNLCRVLNETPIEELESALDPLLDIDGTLRFLALDVALVNSDGYWTRASDYSLFRDSDGKFHIFPHDMNEAFHGGGGAPVGFSRRPPSSRNRRPNGDGEASSESDRPGRSSRRRERQRTIVIPGHGSVTLDPLVGADSLRMPLRGRLLAVPKWRAKYLEYVRTIAETSLDWNTIGPVVASHRANIESIVEADTHKLESFEAFQHATAPDVHDEERQSHMPLRTFFEQRRKFLLDYEEPTESTEAEAETVGRPSGD